MSYTAFGEFVRILRIKHHQVMGDMAKILGTSTPFLSAVENGRKNVPSEWVQTLVAYYGLDLEAKESLLTAIEESRLQYKIVPKEKTGVNQRKAALQFARSFDEMDDETAIKIMELLKNKEQCN